VPVDQRMDISAQVYFLFQISSFLIVKLIRLGS